MCLDIGIAIFKKMLKLYTVYFHRFVKKWKNFLFLCKQKRRFPLALAPFPPQAELICILRFEKALKARRKKTIKYWSYNMDKEDDHHVIKQFRLIIFLTLFATLGAGNIVLLPDKNCSL
jgi:hypothetical protein